MCGHSQAGVLEGASKVLYLFTAEVLQEDRC